MPFYVADINDYCKLRSSSDVFALEFWNQTILPFYTGLGFVDKCCDVDAERRVRSSVVAVEEMGFLRVYRDFGGNVRGQPDNRGENSALPPRSRWLGCPIRRSTDREREEGLAPVGIRIA